jgi:protein ImuB
MTGGVRTLVVRCPDWPVAAAGFPATAPAAVVFANRVVACSAAARNDGVAVGLRRREAQGRCPDLIVVEQDAARDARAFEPVVAAAETFTPRVEMIRPGVVAFATRGPSRYFGGDRALATKVAEAVHAISACQVGVADGPFAAELAARMSGQEAVRVIPPRTSAAFLAPFPVGTLERPDLVDLLTRLGLTTLGDLAALPAATVLARFGPDGAAAHRLARGLDERPLAVRTPPPDLIVVAELDPPAERVDVAAFTAKAMADDLHQKLTALGLACTRIAIEAETEHGEQQSRLWRHDGALSASAVADRVRWQLDSWLSSGATTAGITLLRLVPDEVKPDHGRQLGFWGAGAAADDRAARAMARIQGLLGPEAVVTAVIGGGRDPAGQVRLVPWGDPRQPARPGGPTSVPAPLSKKRTMGAAANEVPPWPGHLPSPAPALVWRRPAPAHLHDADGQPVAISARGEISAPPARLNMVEVAAWAGPWPTEERWWDGHSSRRRARVQLCLADGTAHLAALEGGQWWIEATYD